MRSLLLAPHNDDEVLFACYTILRHRPDVIVCMGGYGQAGIDMAERVRETRDAMVVLGHEAWRMWPYRDDRPDWGSMRASLQAWEEPDSMWHYDTVFAPAVEEGGHEQHNQVGQIALDVFGSEKVIGYTTYRRGYGRTIGSVEVDPEDGWTSLKLRAMACYRSQIDLPATRPWFVDETIREWYR